MSKAILLMSVTGLFIPFVALAAAPPSSSLRCETLGENNSICLSDVDVEAGSKPASKAAAVTAGGAVSMLTRHELSGNALDLENEFESNTVLGDATAVQTRILSPARESETLQARIINVDDLLHNVVFSSPSTRVGAARIKTK